MGTASGLKGAHILEREIIKRHSKQTNKADTKCDTLHEGNNELTH